MQWVSVTDEKPAFKALNQSEVSIFLTSSRNCLFLEYFSGSWMYNAHFILLCRASEICIGHVHCALLSAHHDAHTQCNAPCSGNTCAQIEQRTLQSRCAEQLVRFPDWLESGSGNPTAESTHWEEMRLVQTVSLETIQANAIMRQCSQLLHFLLLYCFHLNTRVYISTISAILFALLVTQLHKGGQNFDKVENEENQYFVISLST